MVLAERYGTGAPVALLTAALLAGFLPVALLWSSDAAAADDTSPRQLVVFTLEGDDSTSDLRDRLTSIIRTQAARSDEYELVNEEPVVLSNAVVILGCGESSTSCLGKAADHFGAEQLVYGTVEDVDGRTKVTVRLFDADEGRYVGSFGRVLSDLSRPYDPFRREVADLLGLEPPAPDNSLRVETNVEGATVSVDGESVGRAPVELENLEPGTYRLRVEANGYESWTNRVEVDRTDTIEIRASLTEKVTDTAAPRADNDEESSTGETESTTETTRSPTPSSGTVSTSNRSSRGWVSSWGPWISIAGGALSLGGATAAAFEIQRAETDLENYRNRTGDTTAAGETTAERSILQRGQAAQRTHRILLGLGGVMVAGGGLWLWFRSLESESSTAETALPEPQRIALTPRSLSIEWRW